jgi:hypothetical protein
LVTPGLKLKALATLARHWAIGELGALESSPPEAAKALPPSATESAISATTMDADGRGMRGLRPNTSARLSHPPHAGVVDEKGVVDPAER